MDTLIAPGHPAEALRYAEASRGLNAPAAAIARKCEAILLSSGMIDEAYRRYAIEANQATTHLATFRAIAKKYPDRSPGSILHDLVASSPGAEGKWFAAAKDAGLLDLAASLAMRGPTDPRTLTRAARDFAQRKPEFAATCGTAALHWMAAGFGYEITSGDVLDAYSALSQAARQWHDAGRTQQSPARGVRGRSRAFVCRHGAGTASGAMTSRCVRVTE